MANLAAELPALIDRARQCQAAGAVMMLRSVDVGLLVQAAEAALELEAIHETLSSVEVSEDRAGEPRLAVAVFKSGGPLTRDRCSVLLPELLKQVSAIVVGHIEEEAAVEPPCDV